MFSLADLIEKYGYFIIFIFIFIETALLVGFFLPGDSLLIFSGYYVVSGRLDIILVIIVATIAAVMGDSVAYSIGRRGGRRLFKKEDSVLFSSNHLRRAEVFFEKHGSVTVLIARPIAFLRTFAPVVAGIGQMEYKRFFIYNFVGGLLWVVAFTFLGWGIGDFLKGKVEIDVVNKWVDTISIVIFAISVGSFLSAFVYNKITKGKSQGIVRLRKFLKRN